MRTIIIISLCNSVAIVVRVVSRYGRFTHSCGVPVAMAGSEASAHQMTNACTARVYRLLTTKKEFNIRMHICHKMSRLARVEARVLVIIGRRGLKVRVK